MPSFEDLTGKRFGKLVVMYRADDYVQPSGQHKRMWHCKCDCGNECAVRASDLKTGNTTSCGCFQQYSRGKAQFEDLTGKTFGRLTVIERATDHITPKGQRQRRWLCKCECGIMKVFYATQLKNGANSCGCVKREERTNKRIQKETEKEKEKRKRQIERERIKEENKRLRVEGIINNELPSNIEALLRSNRERRQEKLLSDSLYDKRPKLLSEWDYEKNGNLTPKDVTCNSAYKVWWLCSNGHSYKAAVFSRAREKGTNCPYCANRKVLAGFNDLKTVYPEIAEEWDYDNNKGLNPQDVLSGSGKKVWWLCPNGHSYEMEISQKTGKNRCGCPYCSTPAKKVLKGFNDLETKFPQIAKEWHPFLNGNTKPSTVLCGSDKKVWWMCKRGHSYEMSISSRTGNKKGNCPYCSNQKLLKGFNDFETLHPEMLPEWNYDLNTILPSEIGTGTHKKVWWKCPFGHKYKTYPSNRVGKNHTGCPICAKEGHTSFPEQALFYYIKQSGIDVINTDYTMLGIELDIYLPTKRIAVEYDGLNWHKNNHSDIKKNSLCRENDITLIRIREEGLDIYEDCVCIVRTNPREEETLNNTIIKVLDYLGIKGVSVDVERDSIRIYEQYVFNRKENSVLAKFPEIAAEWDYSKNGDILPEMINYGSNKEFWWLGNCGHSYKMRVVSRTRYNCGCPYCSGKRVLEGVNDLESLYPELLDEWDYQQNKVLPKAVLANSEKKVWWKCKKCGYVWQTKIYNRTKMKAGCPACADKYIASTKFKPVICVESNTIYKSIKEAAEMTGANPHTIGNCCKGKQKKSGGLHWRYYEGETSY